MNKGRIHGEIRDFSILRKILQCVSTKITEFGLEFTEKSRFEIEIEFDCENKRKIEIKTKLN